MALFDEQWCEERRQEDEKLLAAGYTESTEIGYWATPDGRLLPRFKCIEELCGDKESPT